MALPLCFVPFRGLAADGTNVRREASGRRKVNEMTFGPAKLVLSFTASVGLTQGTSGIRPNVALHLEVEGWAEQMPGSTLARPELYQRTWQAH